MSGRGGARSGAGRKRVLPYRAQLVLGCACEQLWRAIERDNALAKIEQPDVRFMQETAKRLFKAGRLTKTDRKAIAERIDEAIADHRANRGAGPEPSTRIGPALGPRYQVVELKRPYGRNAAQGRNAVIASVIAWATQAKIRNDDGTFRTRRSSPNLRTSHLLLGMSEPAGSFSEASTANKTSKSALFEFCQH